MKTILENPRYTGRQVWNRMANDRDEVDPRTGRPRQYPNLPRDWAISMEIAHAPLVGMREFTAARDADAGENDLDARVFEVHDEVPGGLGDS